MASIYTWLSAQEHHVHHCLLCFVCTFQAKDEEGQIRVEETRKMDFDFNREVIVGGVNRVSLDMGSLPYLQANTVACTALCRNLDVAKLPRIWEQL